MHSASTRLGLQASKVFAGKNVWKFSPNTGIIQKGGKRLTTDKVWMPKDLEDPIIFCLNSKM